MNTAKKWLGLLLATALHLPAAENPADTRLPVRGFCIPSPSANRVDEFIKFIEEELAPRSVNTLILRVDYSFQYAMREKRRGGDESKRDPAAGPGPWRASAFAGADAAGGASVAAEVQGCGIVRARLSRDLGG